MTGSLQEKNDKFYMVLNFYENGKRKLKWIPTGLPVKGNRRKAEQMLRERLIEEERKSALPSSDMRLSDCVRLWLTVAKRRVDEVTYQGYVLIADNQVLPYFDASGLELRDCTPQAMQEFFDEKYRSGRLDGNGGLSASSLRHLKNIINQALKEAVKNGLIASNPCEYVELPRKEKYQSNYYSAEQMQILFAALKDDPLLPLIQVTAFYGLRRSEVLGLKWDSVDFQNNRVLIRHTVVKVTETIEKDKTKNESSRRSFPMTEEIRSIFLALKAEQEEDRRLFGKGYQENDYVFKWSDGHPFATDYVTKHFAKMLKRCGLPHIRFHELRHPYVKHTTKIFECVKKSL